MAEINITVDDEDPVTLVHLADGRGALLVIPRDQSQFQSYVQRRDERNARVALHNLAYKEINESRVAEMTTPEQRQALIDKIANDTGAKGAVRLPPVEPKKKSNEKGVNNDVGKKKSTKENSGENAN